MSEFDFFNPERWLDDEPGFSAGVRYKGENIFLLHRGMAELEYGHKIDDETRFHIASVSKQFAVYLIMVLAQEGKLDLDAPVSQYYKDFPDFDEKITTRHLIHHVSGLRDHWQLFHMAGWRDADLKNMDQAFRVISRQKKLNFPPETEHIYSNTGYTLLAKLIEIITEGSMNDFAKQRIFEPLNMDKSFFREDSRTLIPKRTYSYDLTEDGVFQKSILNYSIYGATSLLTTVQDLLKWGDHLLSLRTENPELYKLMSTDFILKNGKPAQYAGGLMPDKFLGYEILKHGGWDAGYRTSFFIIPELDAVSVCLSNNATFKPEGYAKYFFHQALPGLKDKEDEFLVELEKIRKANESQSCEEICGIYSPDIGSYFYLREKEGTIHIKMPGMLELPLAKHPHGGLWIEGTEMHFFYGEGEDGQSTLTSVYPYSVQKSKKVLLEDCEVEALEKYCGRYYSPELECFHYVKMEEGQLYLHQMRLDDAKLIKFKGFEHSFMAGGYSDCIEGQLDFILEGDSVIGYQLSDPRAKYIQFDKCEE